MKIAVKPNGQTQQVYSQNLVAKQPIWQP